MEDQAMIPPHIKKVRLEALAEALCPVGLVRFIQLFETGAGDYTKDQDNRLGKTSVRSLVDEIKKRRKMHPVPLTPYQR